MTTQTDEQRKRKKTDKCVTHVNTANTGKAVNKFHYAIIHQLLLPSISQQESLIS